MYKILTIWLKYLVFFIFINFIFTRRIFLAWESFFTRGFLFARWFLILGCKTSISIFHIIRQLHSNYWCSFFKHRMVSIIALTSFCIPNIITSITNRSYMWTFSFEPDMTTDLRFFVTICKRTNVTFQSSFLFPEFDPWSIIKRIGTAAIYIPSMTILISPTDATAELR